MNFELLNRYTYSYIWTSINFDYISYTQIYLSSTFQFPLCSLYSNPPLHVF